MTEHEIKLKLIEHERDHEALCLISKGKDGREYVWATVHRDFLPHGVPYRHAEYSARIVFEGAE